MPEKSVTSINFEPTDQFRSTRVEAALGDNRTGSVYVFNDRIRLAVKVALAAGRPLLLRGPSGWGKSSLAAATAKYLDWNYREAVISSRTQARDLQWEVDLLLRLSDAQTNHLEPDWKAYVRPRVLWWAFDPNSAVEQQSAYDRQRRGGSAADATQKSSIPSIDPSKRTVVLIDEIDKADPDVPNNLLVTLGSLQFDVEETGETIRADPGKVPLVFITTNEERALPLAFLRRCVELRLPALASDDPDGSERKRLLVDIATQHFLGVVDGTFVQGVADELMPLSKESSDPPSIPSPAEFNDTVRAAREVSKDGKLDRKLVAEIARITITKLEGVRT